MALETTRESFRSLRLTWCTMVWKTRTMLCWHLGSFCRESCNEQRVTTLADHRSEIHVHLHDKWGRRANKSIARFKSGFRSTIESLSWSFHTTPRAQSAPECLCKKCILSFLVFRMGGFVGVKSGSCSRAEGGSLSRTPLLNLPHTLNAMPSAHM